MAQEEEINEPTEVLRSEKATNCMLIEYAKENRGKVDQTIEMVNRVYPDSFNFFLFEG